MIIILILILSIYIEAKYIDPYFWNKGKSDKPFSTLFYVFIVLIVCFWLDWTPGIILGLTVRASLFDPILNYSRKKNICYHPKKDIRTLKGFKWLSGYLNKQYELFWRQFTCKEEMIIRFVIFIVGYFITK